MTKILRVFAVSLTVFASQTAWAEEAEATENLFGGHQIRIAGGAGVFSTAISDDFDEITASGNVAGLALALQFDGGLILRAATAESKVTEVEFNGVISEVDDPGTTTTRFGVGYRIPSYAPDRFYTFDLSAANSSETDALSLGFHSEKNNAKRYGRVGVSLISTDQGELDGIAVGVDGSHVWFNRIGLGIGLNWSLSSGKLEDSFGNSANAASAGLGVQLMYRGLP